MSSALSSPARGRGEPGEAPWGCGDGRGPGRSAFVGEGRRGALPRAPGCGVRASCPTLTEALKGRASGERKSCRRRQGERS